MDGNLPQMDLALSAAALSRLMPMYLALAGDGTITGSGMTLAKLFPHHGLIGCHLFDVFDLRRIGPITTMAALRARLAQPLTLIRRDGGASLRGLALPLTTGEGLVMNLSFGIGVVDAVRAFALTDADFAPTDLAIELLYVVEAKTAVMGELARLNTGLKGAKSVAEAQALTDTLTGLGNRRALDDAVLRVMEKGRPFALLHLDLDFFKAVNDTHGHAAGDHVLACVAATLRQATRDGDVITRVGGDEFVLILPSPPDATGLQRIAERIIRGLEVPIPFDGAICQISGSIGIAVSTDYAPLDIAAMQTDADAALYASKRAGRGRATRARRSETACRLAE
jgi:diguanylate cyclase (GGDEF)-like protein